MITQLQKDIEDDMYKVLKDGGLGKEVLEKYPNQPIEDLAGVLTEGMMMSWVGDVLRRLENSDNFAKEQDFKEKCRAAFYDAVLRVLVEAERQKR